MIGKLNIIIAGTFILIQSISKAQLNVPNVENYNQSIYQLFLADSNASFHQSHLSFKPVRQTRTNPSQIYLEEGKYYYWLTQKLFKEHFLVFKGEDFICTVDPLVDLQIGQDLADPDQTYRFWNTRGVRVQAQFFDNFGFETSIYENQARLLNYQMNYVNSHGEFMVAGNGYNQVNSVIPTYSRTKPFGEGGYDFAFARGYFNYQPTKWLNIEAGNGNHFIGHGHRSLLLSDFTINYPYLKPEITLLDGRLQYNMIYALHQNLYRLPIKQTPEANFERKMGVSHYLEYSVSKNFQIGIFENNTWVTTDSLGAKPFNYLALNPLIGNTLLNGGNTPNRYNGFFGVNASFNIKKTLFYGQAVFDNNSFGGWQLGARAFNVLLPNLNLQMEYNAVTANTYTSENKRANYNHSNIALAHPLGNDFQELVGKVNYEYKRIFVNYSSIYSMRQPSDSLIEHQTLLNSVQNSNGTKAVYVWFNNVEVGYRFNKKYNLEVYAGYLNRISTAEITANQTNFAYFGLRTNLHHKTLDW